MSTPYTNLPSKAFWRSAVAEASQPVPQDLYERKWPISQQMKIATSGSCFAQHIGRYMRASGFAIMDVEPAPERLAKESHADFGYSIYSARYGNVYTTRQLLQLAQEAFGLRETRTEVWEKNGRYYDPIRPTIETKGLSNPEAVLAHRKRHLERVRQMFLDMDLLIFTLGLTETWIDKQDGTVYPVCPGVIAGSFDDARYEFKNLTYNEVLEDFLSLMEILEQERGDKSLRYLLTVSPVPLTATASGKNVQVSTVYSKSVLRAVAGDIANRFEHVDYFPSYEIVTSPWSGKCFYEPNMRSIDPGGVEQIMQLFLQVHGADNAKEQPAPVEVEPRKEQISETAADTEDAAMKIVCDEELLEAFGDLK